LLGKLAEGPRTRDELRKASGLEKQLFDQFLGEAMGWNPPAVVEEGGRLRSNVPFFTEADFQRMLAENERVPERVFKLVTIPHLEALKARGKELGHRWPLAADTYVRDKALQTLIEEGLMARPPEPPVPWNFGVWGWQGWFAMNELVTQNVQPDKFFARPPDPSEQKAGEALNALLERILKGEQFRDASTPERALLTRIAGWANRDVEALKIVTAPFDNLNQGVFSEERGQRNKQWATRIRIWRVRTPERSPQDGDLAPVFTDSHGEKEAQVFLLYRGRWWYLGNNGAYSLWWLGIDRIKNERLSYLKARGRPSFPIPICTAASSRRCGS
jgi:hypothetical protein